MTPAPPAELIADVLDATAAA
ncbi:MAG: hypothetical protein JWQ53_2188, partial [Klenkia sp.]|nr:hypothetical protein [Klenkia sp.]